MLCCCVVVDRLALICWQLIWLLVTLCVAHGHVTDYGLYLPTDGRWSFFSSMFISVLQYLVKYIELCASRWCYAFMKSYEKQWHHFLHKCMPNNSDLQKVSSSVKKYFVLWLFLLICNVHQLWQINKGVHNIWLWILRRCCIVCIRWPKLKIPSSKFAISWQHHTFTTNFATLILN